MLPWDQEGRVGELMDSRSMLRVAADLRETAHKLMLQAQAIEASVIPVQPVRQRTAVVLIDPRTGKPFNPGGKSRNEKSR